MLSGHGDDFGHILNPIDQIDPFLSGSTSHLAKGGGDNRQAQGTVFVILYWIDRIGQRILLERNQTDSEFLHRCQCRLMITWRKQLDIVWKLVRHPSEHRADQPNYV